MDSEFIQRVRKSPDTIMEVLFVNPIADRLLYILRNHLPSYTPYLFTFLNFLFRLLTLYFVIVDLAYVPFVYYLAILFDGLDGKSSRWIYDIRNYRCPLLFPNPKLGSHILFSDLFILTRSFFNQIPPLGQIWC